MKKSKILLLAVSVVSVASVIMAASVNAAAMPANRVKAQKVGRNIDNSILDGWKSCTDKGEMTRENCVFGYAAKTIDAAMKKTGYSYKDTLHEIAKNGSMLGYMSVGAGDFFTPLKILNDDKGVKFMVKNKLINSSDVESINKMMNQGRDPSMSNVEGMRHQPQGTPLAPNN